MLRNIRKEKLRYSTYKHDGGNNCKKPCLRVNLSSGMPLPTWTSFVGCRIDVRRGKEVAVRPSINVRKGTHCSRKKYIYRREGCPVSYLI